MKSNDESRNAKQKYCCLCGSTVDFFLPFRDPNRENRFTKSFKIIGSDIINFSCPVCKCHDRMRHVHLFMDKLGIYNSFKGASVLYLAPEYPIYLRIRSLTDTIIVGDYNPEQYRNVIPGVVKIDLCRLAYNPESFDVVIANHVLEHIENYIAAMSEVYRVLKKGGFAILQTPYSSEIYNNFEDPLINTPSLREEFYGQADHVRIFGRRILYDLISVGFGVSLLTHAKVLNEIDPGIYGVNRRESLMLAFKYNFGSMR